MVYRIPDRGKNIKNWEKLLRNIEKKINLKIHKYLNNSFNQIISNQEISQNIKSKILSI